ncbi:MAG: putative peptidoglycan glycosyltransferase FtsW [Rickettsiaceae bacterium]|nr:putative peptidoglycan glycosyltransferase FtsW [Rickettsiaceae bacterium]
MLDINKKTEVSPLKIILWRWWRGLDQHLLIAIAILVFFSLILVTTSSPAVAMRIGVREDFFSTRHIIYISLSLAALVFTSSQNIENIKKIGIAIFVANIFFLVLVKFGGYEVKGAKRWINLFGFSLQPSEFIKPSFSIITAFIITSLHNRNTAFLISSSIYLVIATLLLMQPDLGMAVTLSGIWGIQLFVAGLPILFVGIAIFFLSVSLLIAYKIFPHVAERIDAFLDPEAHENYQVVQSLRAFRDGGLFGKGPGEGTVKHHIPDSHADFIFAVAGEEFGTMVCIFITSVFAFIVIKSIYSLMSKKSEFPVLAASGIIAQLAIQSLINIGVTINLLPTKGMTLPFISYGGSSTIAVGFAIGMLLALLRTEISYKPYNILSKEKYDHD